MRYVYIYTYIVKNGLFCLGINDFVSHKPCSIYLYLLGFCLQPLFLYEVG